ncbi:MAG: LamG domain-containing protein, partial [Candidatus Pacebacteria bacterium]|nr:LamG domain-containing protein [Candidatus Paceibacterota bacterium]
VQHLQETPANDVTGHYDSTNNNNDGTPKNFNSIATSTTDGTGKVDGADVFDGTDDYVDAGSGSSLDITDAITIEGWVKNNTNTKSEIGADVQDYSNAHVSGYTYLDRTNCATVDGIITNVSIWINRLEGNNRIKIKTFDALTWPNYQMTGESEFLSVSSTGTNNFSGLNIAVNDGDYIAVYLDGPRVEMETSGGGGIHDVVGDVTGTVAFTSYSSNRRLALHGYIVPKNIINKATAYSMGISENNVYGFINSQLTSSTISNSWNYITFIYNGTTEDIYLNGILKNSSAYSSSIDTNANNLLIGNNFTGQIDQVRIYDYARTPAQIAWDYNRGKPIAHWKFDECQGPTANDASGNGNNGTITIGGTGTQDGIGTCTDGDTSNAWYNGRSGKYSSAMSFDGSDDYVFVGNDASLNITDAITIEAWIKSNTIVGYDTVVRKNNAYTFRLSDGKVQLYLWGLTDTSGISETTLSIGNWYHVTGTYDGSYIKIYINGIQDISDGSSGNIAVTIDDLLIGITPGLSFEFDGLIDDVKIYNYALTAEQIKTEYNGGAVRFE